MSLETEEQYIERRLREENTERFRKEFRQAELLRIAREKREEEEAKATAARQVREKLDAANLKARATNALTETCHVCGTERVPVAAISHPIFGTDKRCIRNPKAAKAAGQLTEDQWDTLTEAEKRDGYIIEFGTILTNEKVLKEHTPEPISGAPNCYGQKLF